MGEARPVLHIHPLEIKANEIYTLEEAQGLLKVSRSTLMRQIKKGSIKAGRLGAQYRFLGRDLLQMINPEWEERARHVYHKSREWVREEDS